MSVDVDERREEPPIVAAFLTEQYKRKQRRAIRRRLGPTWDARARGEYMAIVLVGVLSHRRSRSMRGTWTYKNPVQWWRDLWIGLFLILHIESGVDLRALVVHLASGVQAGGTYLRGGRDTEQKVETHQAGLARIGKRRRRERRKHPLWLPLLLGDFNVGFEEAGGVWIEKVEHITGFQPMWAGVEHPPATHDARGNPTRTIDTAAVPARPPHKARITRPGVVDESLLPAGEDHVGVIFTLVFEVDGVTYRIRIVEISGRYDVDPKRMAEYVAAVLNVPKHTAHLTHGAAA